MPVHEGMRDARQLFAAPDVAIERRTDGATILRSRLSLGASSRCVGDWLVRWAQVAPDRPFLLERADNGEWQGATYAEALDRVLRLASWLLRSGAGPERPVLILSDNSVDHGLLALAAMHVGVPVVPVTPAYSLLSRDFGKLRTILALVDPGVVYVQDAVPYGGVLAATAQLHGGYVVAGRNAEPARGQLALAEILRTPVDGAVQRAFASVTPETVAKILFTSGSTGAPKGVINTQAMLCVNQQQLATVWPFLADTPPIVADWLPWSHTFGGNHNFNLVLRNGGTIYIDAGRPAPGLFERTVRTLQEIAPTIYFNVPRGYDMLVTVLKGDASLRARFFSRLQFIFYAAAALPQHLWEALEEMARETTGEAVMLVSSWGSTETAPLATACHFRASRAGNIGVPVPGCELKLVRAGNKLEVRVRGPNVTPGYWRQPELTAQAFDEEGYYRIGDAVRLVDEARPECGLYFDGRVCEDFKLSSGTWVSCSAIRLAAVAALAPVALDAVVTGHDRDDVGVLVVPNLAACRQLCSGLPADATDEQVVRHPAVRAAITGGLQRIAAHRTGSSTTVTRALVLEEPLSMDAGEITDKGYVNQGAVLQRRQALVEALHGNVPDDRVIVAPA